jgi:hypothetical protein
METVGNAFRIPGSLKGWRENPREIFPLALVFLAKYRRRVHDALEPHIRWRLPASFSVQHEISRWKLVQIEFSSFLQIVYGLFHCISLADRADLRTRGHKQIVILVDYSGKGSYRHKVNSYLIAAIKKKQTATHGMVWAQDFEPIRL